MLCEKCHRRQAEWGTLCEECEKEQASADRKADIVRIIGRLKWCALWMAGDMVVIWGLMLLLSNACGMSIVWTLGILGLMLACMVIPLREWWLWRGYAARIDKGEFSQVAYDLLHHPKGFWKNEIQEDVLIQSRRRRSGISGMVMYSTGLRCLYENKLALEMLADGEE